MNENRSSDVLVSFGVGLLVGAVGALLLAPASGEDTRRQLREFGQDAMDRTRSGIDTARQVAGDQAERLSHAVKEGVREGKEAYAREVSRS